MPKSRILIPYVGDTIGGSHFSSTILVQALKQSTEYEPVVALHDINGPLAPWLRDQGIEPIHIPLRHFVTGNPKTPIRQFLIWLWITPYLARTLKKLDIQLVHTQDLRMHFSWLWAARLARRPHIWHKRNQRRDSRLWGFLIGQATFLITVSKYSMGGLQRWIPPQKTAVVDNPFTLPTGIDSLAAAKRIYQEMGWPEGDKLIITVGTVSRFKRTDIFIETCAQIVKRSNIRCRFAILGRTNNRDQELADTLLSLGIADRVCVAGFRNDVQDWIAAANILISPSEDEPLGRSIIEAMMLGTPVVVSDSGGNREIITRPDFGKVVPLDNPQAFADAAIQILENEEASHTMATQAQQYATTRFRTKSHVNAMTDIYRKLLG